MAETASEKIAWPGKRVRRLALGLLFLAITGAVPQAEAQEGQILAPPQTGLLAVHEPELDKLEAEVREQLLDLRNTLLAAAKQQPLDAGKLSEIYGSMGRVYQAYSLSSPAEECYRNAGLLAAEDFRWPYLLGYLYQQEARLEEAIEAYRQARQLRPSDLATLVHLGDIYLQQHRLPEAADSYKEALKRSPQDAAAAYGLGQVALSLRQYADAVKYFAQALAAAPEANRIHYALAMAYRGLGNLEQAQAHLQQQGLVGVRVSDPLVEALQALVRGERLHLLRGRLAFEARRFTEAVEEFQKAVAANADSLPARVNLGSALAQSGRVKAAIEQFQKALVLDAKNAPALFNLGVLLAREQRPLEAISYLEALVQLHPEDAEAHYRLGQERLKAQRRDDALAAFTKAVELNADNEDALLEQVKLLAQQNAYKTLLEGLEKSHALYPQKGRTALMLAYFLATAAPYELRDGKRALELAGRVYQATGSVNHGAIVALALAELGRCSEAAEWQRKMIAQAEREGDLQLAAKLKTDLRHYENAPSCRPAIEPAKVSHPSQDEPKKP